MSDHDTPTQLGKIRPEDRYPLIIDRQDTGYFVTGELILRADGSIETVLELIRDEQKSV